MTPDLPARVREYVEHGLPLIPLQWTRPDGTCSCSRPGCTSVGKHPVHPSAWQERASCDLAMVETWFRRWPNCNWGAVMGHTRVAMDIDRKSGRDGVAALHRLEAEHGQLPRDCVANTPNAGHHLLLSVPEDAGIRPATDWLPGIDVRAGNAYVVVEPSATPAGVYRFLRITLPPPPAPDWLLELLPRGDRDHHEDDRVTIELDEGAALPARGQVLLLRPHFRALWDRVPGAKGGDDDSPSGWDAALALSYLRANPDAGDQELCDLICAYRRERNGGWGKRHTQRERIGYLCRTIASTRQTAGSPPSRAQEGGHHEAGTAPPAAPRPAADDDPPEPLPVLPQAFWEARETLRLIRRAAHSRVIAADSVLGAVLTRAAGGAPYQIKIPPIVGATVGLTLLTNLMGPPGSGKSSSYHLGTELLPLDPALVADGLPIGTGEGIIEALFETRTEKDPDGKQRTVKVQVRENAVFYADEGAVLGALGDRNGATLLATLRTIFTGGVAGQANAGKETRRVVTRYAYGVVAAVQPEAAATLLAGVNVGTPQRFLWLSSTDPTIDPDATWPDGLQVDLDRTGYARHSTTYPLPVAGVIRNEVRAAALARATGRVAVPTMHMHADLIRLKVAALLAILDHRLEITVEDWQLATLVKQTSDRVLAATEQAGAAAVQRRERETSTRLANREMDKLDHVEARTAHRTVECAEQLRAKVRARPGITVREAHQALWRWDGLFRAALDHAIAEGWVEERSAPGQGTARRTLHAL